MSVLTSISLIKGPEKEKKKAPFIKTGKQNRHTLHDIEEKKTKKKIRYSFETLPESNLIQGKKLLLVV